MRWSSRMPNACLRTRRLFVLFAALVSGCTPARQTDRDGVPSWQRKTGREA